MKKILIIIGVVVIVSLLVFGLIFYNGFSEKHEPAISIKEVHSNTLNESIYLKKISWGLTYDHEIVVVSMSSDKKTEPDSTKEFIFLSSEIFYKVSNDSLYIYTASKVKEPINFNSKFKIEQVELSNPEMMDLRGYDNYKKQGLKMIQ